MFVPAFDSYAPDKQESVLNTLSFLVRKAGHFTEFAMLGFFLMLHISTLRRWMPRHPWLWGWLVSTGYAATDELHQMFVGGRGPAVRDVMIDSSGALCGTLVMVLILYLVKRRKASGSAAAA